MINGKSEARQDGGEGGTEKMDFQKMNFEQLERALKAVRELAATSFKQLGDGFVNAEGCGLHVGERNGVYRIVGIHPSLRRVHERVGGYSRDPVITNGSQNKEEVIQATRKMLEKLGYRIIE